MAAASIPALAAHDSEAASARKWLVAAAVILGAFLGVLDSSIVNVALPYMQGSFAASVDEITWVVTSYLVATGVMIPLTGWIAARIGRKRYFILSMVLFVLGSTLCGTASGLGQMVFFRILQGAAGAATMPLSQAILFETFPPAEHTLAMSVFGLGMMAAPILGPSVGGWITMNWSWRWNFYINVPAGAIATLMVYSFVHDPPYLRRQAGSGRIDYLGILFIVLGLGLLLVVLDRGQRSDWFASQWVCWFAAASALSFILLVIYELRFPEPVIDLRLLKNFGFSLGLALIGMMAFVLFSINLLNPLFTQELLGYDAWDAGVAVAPRGIGVVFAMLAVGQLSRRGHDMRPFIGAGFLLGAYEVWQMAQWNLNVSMQAVLWPILLFGFGFGAIFPTVTASGLCEIPRERMGFATALFTMMVNTGAAIGIACVSNLIISHQQLHQSYLVQHFSAFDAWRVSKATPLMPGTPAFHFTDQLVTGQKQGLGMVYGIIRGQASLLAYNDAYRMLALFALACVPWCMLLPRGSDGQARITE